MTTPPPSPIAVIPARLGSERLPRKVLLAETGTPLIVHVCRATARSSVGRVIVAADDAEIVYAVETAGFEAMLTSPDHANGTSRVAEVAQRLGLADDAVVVNVQGDEPEIEPAVIDAAVAAVTRSDAQVATVASPFGDDEDPADPNLVKAVLDQTGHALLFTRALAPHDRDGLGGVQRYRHVGLYVYRASLLARISGLTPTPLERAERLEQLRFLEHGYRIAVAVHSSPRSGIDTPEQYRAFVERYRTICGAESRGTL
ncbi:MAG: 3-deoxy-manno-octulosonate cytidylyltransferase [Planctomycetota bacterium]